LRAYIVKKNKKRKGCPLILKDSPPLKRGAGSGIVNWEGYYPGFADIVIIAINI